MKHLKLHGFFYIGSFSEPDDEFITFLYTFRCKTYAMIKICQLISPFFLVITLLEFLKNSYTLFKTDILRFIYLVLKDKLSVICRSHLYKLLVILYSLYDLLHLYTQFTQRIHDHPAVWISLICLFEKYLGISVAAVYLIQIAYCTKSRYTPDPGPVYGIGYLDSLLKLPLLDK